MLSKVFYMLFKSYSNTSMLCIILWMRYDACYSSSLLVNISFDYTRFQTKISINTLWKREVVPWWHYVWRSEQQVAQMIEVCLLGGKSSKSYHYRFSDLWRPFHIVQIPHTALLYAQDTYLEWAVAPTTVDTSLCAIFPFNPHFISCMVTNTCPWILLDSNRRSEPLDIISTAYCL